MDAWLISGALRARVFVLRAYSQSFKPRGDSTRHTQMFPEELESRHNRHLSIFIPGIRLYNDNMMNKLAVLLFATILSLTTVCVQADIVTLKDGTVIEGVVIKESRAEVVIEITISNIKTTKKYPRYKVKSIERKPIESEEDSDYQTSKTQSTGSDTDDDDNATSTKSTTDNTATPRERTTRRRTRATRTSATDRTSYIVIPVTGMIGKETNAHGLRNALDLATRKRIQHVVFTIDSGGGYVFDAVETLRVLKEFDEAITYHALVEEGAISAASVYVAASDNIFVRPGSRVGGAVAYTNDQSSGAAEVDAKYNSIWAAEVASRAESKGYPGEIFHAMAVLDAEVWIDEDNNVFASRPTKPAQQIDSRSTILTIRAKQMVEIGMARSFDGKVSELGDLLDLSSWAEVKGIGMRAMTSAANEREKLSKRMDHAMKVYNDAAKEFSVHHPSQYSDYVYFLHYERNRNDILNRRSNRTSISDAQDAESLKKWRERSHETIKHCNLMLEALTEMASINKKAEASKALHLMVSEEFGHQQYQSVVDIKNWLLANLDRVPFSADGTVQTGPEL
jgi:hypothetical protein